jgi:sec-independent protein translocase protein TatA
MGHWELLIILGIVVLLFGAKKLPGLAAGLGQSLRALKKSMSEPGELEEAKPAAPEGKAAPSAEASARAADERKPDEPPRDKSS